MEYNYGPPPNKKMRDLTGMKVGYLTVLGYSHFEYRPTKVNFWVCECSCEKHTRFLVRASDILSGHTKSCGCLRDKINHSGFNKTHGYSNHRLYHIYNGMCRRCYDIKDTKYNSYGGRKEHPVTVDKIWYTPGVKGNPGLLEFIRWSYDNGYYDQPKDTPYRDRLSIDRINGKKGYSPDNCQWIPIWMQASNISTNKLIWNGENFVTHSQFEREAGWSQGTLYAMYKHGWVYDAIIFAANNPELKMHKFNGKYYDKDGFQHLIKKINIPGIDI